MSIVKIDNYVELAQSRLVQLFRENKSNNDLLGNLVTPIQELEEEFFQLLNLKSIENGIGYQLDVIGKILNVDRNGVSDDEYKVLLYIQTLINNSGGEPESIINILDLLIEPDKISYTELYPASYQINIQTDKFLSNLTGFIQSISPAGVGDIILTQSSNDNPLTLEDVTIQSYDYSVDNLDTLLEVDFENGDTLQVISEFTNIKSKDNILGEVFLNEAIYSVGKDENDIDIQYAVDEDKEILLELDLNDANEDITVANFGAKLGEYIT